MTVKQQNFVNKLIFYTALIMLMLAGNQTVLAADKNTEFHSAYEDIPEFGGPSSVAADLKDDAKEKLAALRFESIDSFLKPYFDSKETTNKEHGLSYGFDYTAMTLYASDSLGDDSATGGIFRAYGSWTVLNRDGGNKGTIVYKVENRYKYGSGLAPKDLGFATGYTGFYAPIYSDYDGWGVTNLHWQQKFKDSTFSFIAGVVDATDYLDIYGLINPWKGFSNLAFLTDPTIPAPNQGLGAAFGVMASKNIYVVAGLADTNGDPTKPGDMFDSFFDDSEYFKHVEVGFVSSYERRYFENTHVTLWQADKRVKALTPDGWGAAFSWTTFIDDTWMPFVRVGYADDGGALWEQSIGAGFGYYMAGSKDLLGVGVNLGKPSESSFGPGLDDQITTEVFYRYQLSKNLALTPDLQLIIDPAQNPNEDQLWIVGLRARLAL